MTCAVRALAALAALVWLSGAATALAADRSCEDEVAAVAQGQAGDPASSLRWIKANCPPADFDAAVEAQTGSTLQSLRQRDGDSAASAQAGVAAAQRRASRNNVASAAAFMGANGALSDNAASQAIGQAAESLAATQPGGAPAGAYTGFARTPIGGAATGGGSSNGETKAQCIADYRRAIVAFRNNSAKGNLNSALMNSANVPDTYVPPAEDCSRPMQSQGPGMEQRTAQAQTALANRCAIKTAQCAIAKVQAGVECNLATQQCLQEYPIPKPAP